MKQDIIKKKDTDFDIQQDSIMKALTTNAVAWGIPNATIALLTASQTTWNAAWLAAKDKGMRTPSDVQAKKNARTDYVANLRPALQAYVQKNPLVTNADRVAMGVPPLNKTRKRSAVPTTVPQVDLKIGNGNIIHIFFKQGVDEQGVGRRGKPDGVSHAEVAINIGDPAPASADDCLTHLHKGRSPYQLQTTPADVGKRLYVFARWVNPRHEPGPWTTAPLTLVIPG